MKHKSAMYLKRVRLAFLFFALLTTWNLSAQTTQSISGTVVDATNEAVIGASVSVKGSNIGTATDIDGNFTLSGIPTNAILQISYVGYTAQEVAVAGKTHIDVVLKEDNRLLDEVVVIGYGSQKKKEVTGAVSSIKAEDFNSGVKNSPMGLLQGKVAGLTISRTTGGDPTNTEYKVQIRGFSTLDKGAGTSPLYIVDGIPVNNIDNIAPDDIASMDVLKDGSAAAIYGTRGTNGVIIITTKRGENTTGKGDCGVRTVEYSGYASVSTIAGNLGMATPDEYYNLNSISGGKINPVIYADKDGAQYKTDWLKEVTRAAAITHNHNLAISGANGRSFSYRASFSFKNAEGIAKTSNRNELTAKFAANQQAFDGWLDLQYDLSYMHYRNDFFCGTFKEAAILNPSYPVYDASQANGYYMPTGTGRGNPVEQMNQKESYGDGNYFRGSIRPTINIKPVPGLKASAFAAWEEGDNYTYWYNKIINTDEAGSNKGGRKNNRNINKLFEGTIDYSIDLGKNHIVAMLGASYQNFWDDKMEMSNRGFPYESMKWYQIANGDASQQYLTVDSGTNSHTLAATFGRVNYSFDEKYLISASLRHEGSSRFGANQKWGWFPAVSAGWRLTREAFMQNVSFVDDLKLRFGFGITGNDLKDNLMSLPIYTRGGSFWDGASGKYVYTYTIQRNQNSNLQWEKKAEYNVGIDFAFLKNRLMGTIDAYLRNTTDLLWDYDVPLPPFEYPKMLANIGTMQSKGLEISLTGIPVQTQNFTWATTPTIAFNTNKIINLQGKIKDSYGREFDLSYSTTYTGNVGENGIMNTQTQILKEGETVGNFWGYKYAYTDEDGLAIFHTPTGGYTPVPNDGQKMVIGHAQPLFTFGWNNTLNWKNWDLSLFFRGVYGNDVLNVTRWAYGAESNSISNNVFMKDVREGKLVDKSRFTSALLEDGSYVKLDNLTLGYNFKLKDNSKIQSIRAYFTAQNVFTLTSYSGIDPEINTTSVSESGIDYPDFYPSVRNFMVGLNITF
jgi:TonB-linked SusC/RagA family outer membrane protein